MKPAITARAGDGAFKRRSHAARKNASQQMLTCENRPAASSCRVYAESEVAVHAANDPAGLAPAARASVKPATPLSARMVTR